MRDDAYVNIQEAASFLGVTAATLRNWDRAGRLKPVRHPVNNYRMYRLADVMSLRNQETLFPVAPPAEDVSQKPRTLTGPELKRIVKALHRVLRDYEGNSSLIERFDELTKLLYCKVLDERRGESGAFFVAAKDTDAEVAKRIRELLTKLETQNPALFPQRFSAFQLADRTLRRLVEVLAPVRLSNAAEDLKGLAYEEVIKNTFDKGDHQQFFTPRAVVEFMVGMLDWEGVRAVCDPACGTGGFLLHVERHLRHQQHAATQLIGFEIDERLAWVTGINLDMHEAKRFEVRQFGMAGSLGHEIEPYLGQIDAIVTNPPFGSDLSDPDALARFELGRERPSRRRGVLFIERCLQLLKPGGQLGIIIDDGVLNAPSNEDTRRLILREADLWAIVSLPDTAFMPYASVKASILFLQKHGAESPLLSERGTYFASAELVGRRPNGDPLLRFDKTTGHMELDSDLPAILRAWQHRDEGVVHRESSGAAFLSRMPDIDDAQFSKEGYRFDPSYHHPARHEAIATLNASPYPLRRLSDLCDLRNDVVVPSTDLQDEEFTYLSLAHIAAHTGVASPIITEGASVKSAVKRFLPGDILFAKMRPELRKVVLIGPEIDEGYASAECLVLVPRREAGDEGPFFMLPELLSMLLRSDLVYGQIVHLVIGIGRPRLGHSAVMNVKLPCPPISEQYRLLELFKRTEAAAQALLVESEKCIAKSQELIAQADLQLLKDLLQPSRRS